MPTYCTQSSKDNCCTSLRISSVICWDALDWFWWDFVSRWCCSPGVSLRKGLLIQCRTPQPCKDRHAMGIGLSRSCPGLSTLERGRLSTFCSRLAFSSYPLLRALSKCWLFWFGRSRWWGCCLDGHSLSFSLATRIYFQLESYCKEDTRFRFRGILSSFWIYFGFRFRGWIRNSRISAE